MENTLVVVNPAEYGLEKSEAQKIESVFTPMLEKMVELEKEYNEIIALPMDPETSKRAKDLRLKYVKIRTATDKIHKDAKAYYLAGGRFVDAWKNTQNFSVIGKETELEKIEKHDELIQQAKKDKLNEDRQKELAQYVSDVTLYNLKEMSEAGFNELLASSKIACEARQQAEKKAEEDRIAKEKADKEEQERVRLENARLKEEAVKREQEIAKERAEAEKERQAAETKAKAEAIEKAKLEAEEKAKNEAEAEAKRKAELAPDKEKLLAYAAELEDLAVPSLQTAEAKATLSKALAFLGQTIAILKNE